MENDTNNDTTTTTTPQGSSRCCQCINFDGNQEARAFAYDSTIIGTLIIGAVFLSSANIKLALNDAGCLDLPDGPTSCENRVYGMKPTSLLTLMTTLTGLLASLAMPVMGAIVDHTSLRLTVAVGTAVPITAINMAQICVSETTWFAVALMQVAGSVLTMLHMTVTYAYLGELTKDNHRLAYYNAIYQGLRSLAMLATLFCITLLATLVLDPDTRNELSYDIGTARVAQIFQSLACIPLFVLSFYKGFKPRAALSKVPEGSSLFTAGFKKLFGTFRRIYHHFPGLMWNIIANILFMSVISATPSIAITYQTTFLNMNAVMSGVAILIFLAAAIVGSVIMPRAARLMGIYNLLRLGCVLMTVMTVLISTIISGPDQTNVYLILSAMWGMLYGWIVPAGRQVFLSIMPKGQASEMMGIYIFCANGFLWLPPLIVTIMNENGISIRYGILTLGLMTILAFGVLCMAGNYEEAVEKAESSIRDVQMQVMMSDEDDVAAVQMMGQEDPQSVIHDE